MMIDQDLLNKVSQENPEFHRLYQDIKTLNERENEFPKVVVCGLLKAGKSSLLNVLTGNFDEEYFVTNAARATTEVKSCEVNNVIYIDTPGIDANKEDDKEAWKGLIDADIILFTHNLREGNIVASEKQFIEEMKNKTSDLSHKLIVIFTNADSVPEEEKEHTINNLHKEISYIVDFKGKPIIISSIDYKLGKEEAEQELINISGIPTLQENIKEMVDFKDFTSERNKHISTLKKNLEREAIKIINKRKETIESLKKERKRKFSLLRDDLLYMDSIVTKRIESFNQI